MRKFSHYLSILPAASPSPVIQVAAATQNSVYPNSAYAQFNGVSRVNLSTIKYGCSPPSSRFAVLILDALKIVTEGIRLNLRLRSFSKRWRKLRYRNVKFVYERFHVAFRSSFEVSSEKVTRI